MKINIKTLMSVVVIIATTFTLSAGEFKLKYNGDKKFKIVQFTDCHFFKGGEKSEEVLENIKIVMDIEKPDLVVLTGDIVTGKGENWPTIESWEILTKALIKYKTPYAVCFGNHETQAQTSREELYEYLSKRPYCLISDEGGDKIKGIGNYVLPVYNNKGTAERLIYCMDSGTTSTAKDKGVNGYAWFDNSQIRWFADTNQSWLAKNKNIKSFLFFHIPLPEYKRAFENGEFRKGVRMEEECSPSINTGMFSEMVLQRNVLGSFVGHDHNNNYIAQLYGIALGYGYFSGGNTYADLPLNGARIILLEENKESFTTWLRRRDGKILYKLEFPYSEVE